MLGAFIAFGRLGAELIFGPGVAPPSGDTELDFQVPANSQYLALISVGGM